jgi:hypothetical protein
MEQDEQTPADRAEQGQCPFGPPLDGSPPKSPPPITMLADERPPIRPYAGQTCVEAVLALVLSVLGISGMFVCCFGMLSVWMELGALMLAVTAKKKIRANPYLGGDGLATAAISIALIVLGLYALGSIAMFLFIGFASRF